MNKTLTNQTQYKAAMPQLIRLLALVAITFLVNTGCQTANGFGKDMEKAGEKIQDGTR
jgi:predicted small secreted protein